MLGEKHFGEDLLKDIETGKDNRLSLLRQSEELS